MYILSGVEERPSTTKRNGSLTTAALIIYISKPIEHGVGSSFLKYCIYDIPSNSSLLQRVRQAKVGSACFVMCDQNGFVVDISFVEQKKA